MFSYSGRGSKGGGGVDLSDNSYWQHPSYSGNLTALAGLRVYLSSCAWRRGSFVRSLLLCVTSHVEAVRFPSSGDTSPVSWVSKTKLDETK